MTEDPTAPDEAATERAEDLKVAERTALRLSEFALWNLPPDEQLSMDDIRALTRPVLAELDRQRGLIAAVLAECSEAEAVAGWNTARVTVTKIRTLLEGEGR